MAIELEITALPWLERLLAITTFFSVCDFHENEARNELCNKYCLDCNERPLCKSCIKTSDHDDHRVIQIRRSSENVVKATEIGDHIDISGIQTYTINSAKVVFLSRNAQVNENTNYKCTGNCRVCQRYIVESSDFCSLACKFQWVKENGTFVLRARKNEEKGNKSKETTNTSSSSNDKKKLPKEMVKRKLEEEKEEENEEQKAESVISRPVSFRRATSRRKGIPHRAPFF